MPLLSAKPPTTERSGTAAEINRLLGEGVPTAEISEHLDQACQ
jgi:hypothetical protein